jgi:phthalate 4,5-cis-dihydrodiol dehydrogenase
MIGVGIAGAGHFAAQHVRALAAFPDLRLVAVSAGGREAAEAFAASHGGRARGDWRHLLDDPAVDVVLVTTPHHLHAPIAIAAAGAGKHVLVEKPMASNFADCIAMARAAAQGGVCLLVAHVMRFVRPCLAAREIVAAGTLGRPLLGRSAMMKRWMEANRRPWHLSAETGGGMLLTAGIHALDRLVWLMDAPVESVAAMSGNLFHDQPVPDADLLLLRFAGRALGMLASTGYRDGTMINDTEIVCEAGTLRLDLETGVSVGQGGQWTSVPGSTEPDWLLRGLEREWRAMRSAICDGTPPAVGAADAAALVACIETAQAAAAARREISVPGWPA